MINYISLLLFITFYLVLSGKIHISMHVYRKHEDMDGMVVLNLIITFSLCINYLETLDMPSI